MSAPEITPEVQAVIDAVDGMDAALAPFYDEDGDVPESKLYDFDETRSCFHDDIADAATALRDALRTE